MTVDYQDHRFFAMLQEVLKELFEQGRIHPPSIDIELKSSHRIDSRDDID